MSGASDLTLQAVRLALGVSQLRADVASRNVANASVPGAQALRADFASSQHLLERAAAPGADGEASLAEAISAALSQPAGATREDAAVGSINLDEQVADMATANLEYQALTESLNRHFGLMRLAISGRN